MNPYIPVVIVFLFALLFGAIMMSFSYFLGPKRYSREKHEPYECGVPIIGEKDKMSVKFSTVAILFILFDIEAVFLILWAVTFRELGWFGIIEVFVFLTILLAGYVYVIKRGALEWD